ncbi:hypothetical protein NBRC116592_28000 [Colwellia sp. KU-HH00111]|uniref:ComEA family DNA-binding protein n=1 Tax=Colwellia sp. KU-HH00111 TaxID=3127652 RepID=UPI0031064D10
MKVLSLKALSCALLTSTLLLNGNLAVAETKTGTDAKPVTEAVVKQQVVHLNKSTIDDLLTLKGIGHKKAQAILTYRQQVGDFKSVADLAKVKGIGNKVLIDNKARLKI